QRVAFARAIVGEPKLLLLDEPLSNLDAGLREEMRTELLRLQREIGITTVYVTHDQTEALTLSDRIAVVDRGRILQVGPPTEIAATTFMGVNLRYDVRVADRIVGIITPPRRVFSIGDKVVLRFPFESAVAVPPEPRQ